MAKPLPIAAFRGGNKSLTLNGKTFPVGPQITTFKPFAQLGLPLQGAAIVADKTGAIIDGFDLRGHDLLVQAENVTVRNCRFNAIAWHTLNNEAGKRGLIVELNMFDGERKDVQHSEFVFSEGTDTVLRGNIFLDAPTDTVNVAGGIVEHNAFSGAGFQTGAHADAISIHKTNGPIIVRENYIDFISIPGSTGTNSCLKVVSHFGPIDNVLIENNVMLGGGYNAYCGDGGKGLPNDVRFLNNLFGMTSYGDKPINFLVGENTPANGTNFKSAGNSLFSAAPDSVVSIGTASIVPPPSPVPSAPVNPVCTVKPTIEGGRTVGEKAVTASGTWKDAKPDWSFVWAWTLDGKLIEGAKSWEYTPAAPGQLVVAVAVTTPAGGKTIVTSDPVTVVPAAAPVPTPVPTPAPEPAPDPTFQLRQAMTQTAATLESLAGSLRQLAKQ